MSWFRQTKPQTILLYVNTLKQELDGTRAYLETDTDVMTERLFSLPLTKVGIHFGHFRMCATPCPISLIIFILDLGPSYTDKLLEFRWVQIAHLL